MRFAGIFAVLPLAEIESYDVPWVPTRHQLISHIMRLAKISKDDVFYDLGCGDGRVVIEAAKLGARAVCVEIRKDLIEKAKENARQANVYDRITFINGNFFQVDLSNATVVYMYLLTRINAALRPKLEKELQLGTRVITLDFEIPRWRPVHVEKHYVSGLLRTIYLYVVGVSNTFT